MSLILGTATNALLVGAATANLIGLLLFGRGYLRIRAARRQRHPPPTLDTAEDRYGELAGAVPEVPGAGTAPTISRRVLLVQGVGLATSALLWSWWFALRPLVSFADSGEMWTLSWSPSSQLLASAGDSVQIWRPK